MSGASSRDDGRKMDNLLKAMSSASSILKATSSTSGGDDGGKMPKGEGLSSVKEADQGNRRKCKGRGSSLVEGADKWNGSSLKKGPWTQEEDAVLKEFVKKHGDGNWKAVENNSGLARCAKSCRLRWTNHLKPNLKKGAITAEEEQRIVELHSRMGNKWSKMAAQLPGRTDNEIKNFWNTRVKRRQRAGLNPEEVEMYRQQVPNADQENPNPAAALTNEAGQHGSISQTESNGIPDVEFKGLKLLVSKYDPSIHMPTTVSDMLSQKNNMLPMKHPSVSDRLSQQNNMLPMKYPSVSDMFADLDQSTYSSLYNMFPMMHPSKRLRGSDMIYNNLDPSAIPAFHQYGTSDPRLLSPCDLIFNTSNQFVNDLIGNHANLNGNISALTSYMGPLRWSSLHSNISRLKNISGTRDTPESSLPPLESVDTPESSIQFQPNQSETFSHQNNDGLLESVIYSLNGSKNVDSFQENNDDDFVLNEEVQSSTLNPSETQRDEQEALRTSLEPEALRSPLRSFTSLIEADYTYITNRICSMETTEDDGDKHGALTEFPADSPSPEDQNPIESLLNPEPVPDLSFMENGSPSPENQNPMQSLSDPGPVPDLSFMENDSSSPENQNPIQYLLDPKPAPDLSFMDNDSPSPKN